MSASSPHSKRDCLQTFETRIAIIRRKAQLMDISVPDDVSEYIANRLKTNIRQLEGPADKLDVIDQQNICLPVFLPELRGGMVLDRFDHFVGEFIALDIDDGTGHPKRSKHWKTVCGPASNKKRVIGIGRVGGDRERRCVCKFIGGADNKRIEGEIVFPTDCEAIRILSSGRNTGRQMFCWSMTSSLSAVKRVHRRSSSIPSIPSMSQTSSLANSSPLT